MKLNTIWSALLTLIAVSSCMSQILPPAGKTTGPGVQAAADTREPEVLKQCKVPPVTPAFPGQAKGKAKGTGPAAAPSGPRDYAVMEIPGVIAAGQKWKEIWTVDGNNADGIIATKNGDLLIAQNDNSQVLRMDPSGKTSVAFTETNTGGSLAMNSKSALFVVNRGLNPSIERLDPRRAPLANKMNGDPLDCLGGILNDAAADNKGGVYFTNRLVYYADPHGKVTRFGENLNTNGIALSADETRLFVTNGPTVAVFDVQKDGSLTHQREFAKLEGGGNGDGMAFDAAGRLYVTTNPGVQVIGPDGKYLGIIPTPYGVISVTFASPDRKTLYVVARENSANGGHGKDWILGISMIAQGPKGRAK
jgi:gluconolactonase